MFQIFKAIFLYFSGLLQLEKSEMFTIGIFSTHIPYIAFLVFYAYFLIFGVQKVSNIEAQNKEKSTFITEIQVEQNIFNHNPLKDSYNCDFFTSTDFETFIFKRKIKHRMKFNSSYYPVELFTSLSNRPPPVLV